MNDAHQLHHGDEIWPKPAHSCYLACRRSELFEVTWISKLDQKLVDDWRRASQEDDSALQCGYVSRKWCKWKRTFPFCVKRMNIPFDK